MSWIPMRFRFQVPKPPEGEVVEITAEAYEEMLLKRLADPNENRTMVMWELAQHCKNHGKVEQAMAHFKALLDCVESLEAKAKIVLALGQTSERAGDFEMAIGFYRHALAMEPTDVFTDYFVFNNLGYSLVQLGQFVEAEAHCRQAIQIDPTRCNAHKNLGLALQGQGRLPEAAQCFVSATQANASDDRSLHHLLSLLTDHPHLKSEFLDHFKACREAVAFAAKERRKAEQPWKPTQPPTGDPSR